MATRMERRRFLETLGRGAPAAAVVAALSPARAYPTAETLRVGAIGCGGRMQRALLPNLKKIDGTRLVAVCDVWDRRLEEARALAAPGALVTRDHHEVLERKDVDAVVIATPDHWHVPVTVDACRAGKDVYVEKPLTHHPSEAEAVVAAQDEHDRVVQVGMQQRSMPHIRDARKIARGGALGPVHRVHISWNRNSGLSSRRPPDTIDPETVDWKRFLGNAPERPWDEYRYRHWRWFWDYGGGILTDLMVHLIDVANWCLDLEGPAAAASFGDHVLTEGLWETPDTIQTLLHWPDRKLEVFFEGTFFNRRHGARLEIQGRDASLYIDRGRFEVLPERDGEPERRVVGEGGRGADFYREVNGALLHLRDWVAAVRARRKPAAPAEAGVNACRGAHLGNRAFRSGSIAHRDA